MRELLAQLCRRGGLPGPIDAHQQHHRGFVRVQVYFGGGIQPVHQLSSERFLQVNILHIRALIKADTVILFDSYGSSDSQLHSVFLYHLEVRSLASEPRCPQRVAA